MDVFGSYVPQSTVNTSCFGYISSRNKDVTKRGENSTPLRVGHSSYLQGINTSTFPRNSNVTTQRNIHNHTGQQQKMQGSSFMRYDTNNTSTQTHRDNSRITNANNVTKGASSVSTTRTETVGSTHPQPTHPQPTHPQPARTPKKQARQSNPDYTENNSSARTRGDGVKDPLIKPEITTFDFDILNVDALTRNYLSSKISNVDILEKELNMYIHLSKSKNISQKIRATEQAEILRKRIRDLESTMELAFYILKSSAIIEEYKSLIKSGDRTKSFLIDIPPKGASRGTKVNTRIQELKTAFLGVVGHHITVKVPRKKSQTVMSCEQCKSTDLRVNSDDDSLYTCGECYNEFEVMVDTPSFKDTDRVNLTNKFVYSRKGHFIDAIKRFQCEQKYDPKKVKYALEVITKEMEYHGLTSKRGLSNSVTRDNIYTFLTEQSLNTHYNDLNLLYSLISGERPPDISMYVDDIMEDFELLEAALKALNDDSRVNSWNVYFKLYKLLQRRGYKCRKNEFYVLKTKEKEDEHDEKLKQAFDLLGWEWKPTF